MAPIFAPSFAASSPPLFNNARVASFTRYSPCTLEIASAAFPTIVPTFPMVPSASSQWSLPRLFRPWSLHFLWFSARLLTVLYEMMEAVQAQISRRHLAHPPTQLQRQALPPQASARLLLPGNCHHRPPCR